MGAEIEGKDDIAVPGKKGAECREVGPVRAEPVTDDDARRVLAGSVRKDDPSLEPDTVIGRE